MRLAKVKKDFRLPVVNAHTGRKYVKNEWRMVPDDGHVSELLDYKDDWTEIDEPEEESGTAVFEEIDPVLAADIEDFKKSELQEMAREAGVKGFSTMSKDELVDALRDD